MITSRLTTRAQTTVPKAVRDALRVRPGDTLAYRIKGDRVILTKAPGAPTDSPFATFREWDSEKDRRADADL